MSWSDAPRVLTINSGSSSLKFALFEGPEGGERRVLRGAVERIGALSGVRWIETDERPRAEAQAQVPDHRAAITSLFAALAEVRAPLPDAVGHRLVHGGPRFDRPVRVDGGVLSALRELSPFAPLHLPAEIAGIEAVAEHLGDVPQIATFDTAFHHRLPEVARRFALPAWCSAQGIRRYGFHGLSYEYVVSALGSDLAERTIVAHLGNGSSLVALRGGVPVDTTMGLTPCGGVMMGTRSGDLDPGVLTFLAKAGHTTEQIEHLVNQESGLLGVSGSTSDMQALLDQPGEAAAALAVSMYCYQARKSIGAMAAALGGVELLVFTGGIGAHAAAVRETICAGLAHLGIALDLARNREGEGLVSSAEARCPVRAITTDEELVIARHARAVLRDEPPS